MSPIDWAKRPLTKYADLSGRAPRAEFWWFFLAVIVAALVAQIIDSILGIQIMGPYGPLYFLVMLGAIVPNITVAVRRLHDTNRSGWWLLLPLLPYLLAFILGGRALLSGSMTGIGIAGIFLLIGAIGAIILLVFMILSGTPADNRYGPPPSGDAASVATV
jgi:uncharacterized membrane protein YhaH (DUF805 family)